jgi:hypothetical protein
MDRGEETTEKIDPWMAKLKSFSGLKSFETLRGCKSPEKLS